MPGRNSFSVILLTVTVLLLWTDGAMAYVGPGAGLEFVGYFFSIIAMGAMAFSMILLRPFYALIRRIRGIKDPIPSVTPEDPSATSPEAPLDGSQPSA